MDFLTKIQVTHVKSVQALKEKAFSALAHRLRSLSNFNNKDHMVL